MKRVIIEKVSISSTNTPYDSQMILIDDMVSNQCNSQFLNRIIDKIDYYPVVEYNHKSLLVDTVKMDPSEADDWVYEHEWTDEDGSLMLHYSNGGKTLDIEAPDEHTEPELHRNSVMTLYRPGILANVDSSFLIHSDIDPEELHLVLAGKESNVGDKTTYFVDKTNLDELKRLEGLYLKGSSSDNKLLNCELGRDEVLVVSVIEEDEE